MPDRMLCAVLEQFQLYFSLWYVRFVSIQSVISSCVLMLKQPVHFCFFCIHTSTQTHTQTRTRAGNTSSHLLTLHSRPYSLIYWRLGVQYDEDHVRSFSNGKLLELFQCEYTCPVFHVCYVVYHGGHSTMQHMFNYKVHTSLLAIQVRVAYFA